MKIEQRIGRLSRIGQTHDVHVFNLVAADTVEAAVLHLLEAKLNMFELVIGEVDMILGNLDDEKEFQDVVTDLWAESADTGDFGRRMEELGNRLLAAKEEYLAPANLRRPPVWRPLHAGGMSDDMDDRSTEEPLALLAAGAVRPRLRRGGRRRLG